MLIRKFFLLSTVITISLQAMENNVPLSCAIELHPDLIITSNENASHSLSCLTYDNDDYAISHKKECDPCENDSQNWFADISDNYKAKKKLYKQSFYTMPTVIKDHSCPVSKFLVDGPNHSGTTVTYIESRGTYCLNVFNKHSNSVPLTYAGSILSMALSADTKLALCGPHLQGFYFAVYDIIFKPDKPLLGKKREVPQLVNSGLSYAQDLGLLFKKMTFMTPEMLWCVDLKNKLRRVCLDYKTSCVTSNDLIPLPLGKNHRVAFFASDPASRQHILLVDNYSDIYTGMVLQDRYLLKKLRTLSSIIATVKEQDKPLLCCLKEVRLANNKCFFIFNSKDPQKKSVSHLPTQQIVCKFDLAARITNEKQSDDRQLFVLPFVNNQ